MFETSSQTRKEDFYNLSLRLRGVEKDTVQKELKRLDVSKSDFLRLCLQAYFEKQEKEKNDASTGSQDNGSAQDHA